ncbi:MAG: hypothetical protein WDN44_14895 [Sphingomonas sp.]
MPMPMPEPAPAAPPEPLPMPAEQQTPAEMPGMDMAAPPQVNASPGSGTSRLPGAEGAMTGLHWNPSGWMVMAHGYALAAYTDQGGSRGDAMAYTGTMAMLEAERALGGARLQLRGMLSLDPINGERGYPNLFATGETAHGVTLVDRQHPHDLFMELSARVGVPVAAAPRPSSTAAPSPSPRSAPRHSSTAARRAISPIRRSATIGSTARTSPSAWSPPGIATNGIQLEASAFRGREPDENRWDIETPRLDSWSVRATWSPTPNWTAQVSTGRLESPEAQQPDEDERRTTASVHYAGGGFAAMAGFAAKHRVGGETLTAWIGEANWDLTRHHSLFGRVENVASDELFPDPAAPFHDTKFRVTRFEGGYAYRIPLGIAEMAIGGSAAAYAKPAALDPRLWPCAGERHRLRAARDRAIDFRQQRKPVREAADALVFQDRRGRPRRPPPGLRHRAGAGPRNPPPAAPRRGRR